MEKITKRIIVKDAAETKINYVQGTTMIPLTFTIDDFVIPAAATALMITKKPSGMVAVDEGIIDTETNSVTVNPTAQTFAESGEHKLQIHIAVEGETLNSYLIRAKVEPCIITDDMVESNNDFTGLAKVVQDAVSVAYAAVADYCEDNGIVTGASPEQAAQLESLITDMADIKAGISGGTFDDWKEDEGEGEEDGN